MQIQNITKFESFENLKYDFSQINSVINLKIINSRSVLLVELLIDS